MNNDNGKIITVSFLIAAAVVYAVVRVILEFAAINIGPFAKYWSDYNLLFKHIVPLVIAGGGFVILQLNSGVKHWADECVSEVRKVVWPSKKDTSSMTIVTCVMVIISGGILGFFDFVSTQVVKMFINL